MARDIWYRLDNVGKFYSSQAGSSLQTTFRYSATLADDLDAVILKDALAKTVEVFPGFNVCLRSGMFWHYLEKSKEIPVVSEENLPICYGLHVDTKSILFRVSYYQARVNLEVSHIVSDGRGTLNFFKALLYEYLRQRYDVAGEFASHDGSDQQKAEDSFNKYYERDKAAPTRAPKVYRLSGWKDLADPTFVEYHLPAQSVLDLARFHGVSLTALLIAAVMFAIRDEMPKRFWHRAIRMDIPVDLRQVFPSATTRNFFGLAFVSWMPEGNESLPELAAQINEQLKAACAPENLKARMNRMIALEKSPLLRFAPMFLKDIVIDIANRMTARTTTTTVSNLGRISFDSRLAPYVKNLNVLTSTTGLNFTICSFADDLSIGISTVFSNLDILKNLCRFFTAQGIEGSMNINKTSKEVAADQREVWLETSVKRLSGGLPGGAANSLTGSSTGGAAKKTCGACGISLSGDLQRCPLCQSLLQGKGTAPVFPRNETKRSGTMALNLLAFISGLGLLLMLLLWQLVPLPGDIVFTVSVALIVNYLFVRNILMRKPDFLRVIARYFLVLIALSVIWFLLTGNIFVPSFVIPGICLLGIIFDAVLIAIFSSHYVVGYAKYLLFDVVLGFAPLVFVALNLTIWPPLAYSSAFVAAVFFLAILIFMRKHLLQEIRKLFSL